MSHSPSIRCLAATCLTLILVLPASSYDFPLSESAIRDAYFLGSRQASLGASFLAEYKQSIGLKAGSCTSEVRLETPFAQVADFSSRQLNYSAQDAVKAFRAKTLPFRVFLDICYKIDAPPPYSLHIKIIQNRREVLSLSDQRSGYFPATDEYTTLPSNGEQINLEFAPAALDSSDLTIRIDTADDQHASVVFDLRNLR